MSHAPGPRLAAWPRRPTRLGISAPAACGTLPLFPPGPADNALARLPWPSWFHARLAPVVEPRAGLLTLADTVTPGIFACATRLRRLVSREASNRPGRTRKLARKRPCSRSDLGRGVRLATRSPRCGPRDSRRSAITQPMTIHLFTDRCQPRTASSRSMEVKQSTSPAGSDQRERRDLSAGARSSSRAGPTKRPHGAGVRLAGGRLAG